MPSEPSSRPDADVDAAARERRHDAALRRALDRRVAAVVEGMSDAFLALDAGWRVVYANREAARLNGTTAAALVGADHWARWPETAGSEVERQYRRAVAEGVAVQLEHYYAGVDRWHDIRAYPAEEGGLAIFFRDITATKRLEAERARQAHELAQANEKALAAETQFRLLVERVRDYGLFLLDPDGIITHWGHGAQRMQQWTAEEIVGQHLRRLYPEASAAEDGTADDHLAHAAAAGEYIGEGRRQRRDGTLFPARAVLTALRRDGRLVGFSKIVQDLTGERERETALRDAIAAAQAANTAKSQFLANTSHEIRTPLNAVIGYAELLSEGIAGPLTALQRQYVGRIDGAGRHLLALINDVLDLSKIEAGAMRTVREAASVRDAAAAALALVEPQARARQLRVTNACAGAPDGAYLGDPERVRQILVNLLSNAVRFTEAEGRVTVSCGTVDRLPPGVVVEGAPHLGPWTFARVEDTGVGIPPDQLDHVWEAFVQADATRTRKYGGSGLGLTISRHLARLMGGDITVRSAPGLGTTFIVWLPGVGPTSDVARAGVAAAPPAQSPREALATVSRDATVGAGVREIAAALLGEVERIVRSYAARVRSDVDTPSAHALGEAQVEDHMVTFLADVTQCLVNVADDGPDGVAMLRDGSEIQRLIAIRHGAQRARLGWQEPEVRREYALLWEELHAAVRRAAPHATSAAVERTLAVLRFYQEAAEAASVVAFRAAREAPDGPPHGDAHGARDR